MTSDELNVDKLKIHNSAPRYGPWHIASSKEQLELSQRLAVNVPTHVAEEKFHLQRPKLQRPVLSAKEKNCDRIKMSDNFSESNQSGARSSAGTRSVTIARPVTGSQSMTNSNKYDEKITEYPSRKRLVKSGVSQCSVVGGRSVNSKELNCIVSRLVRPTLSSRGGVDLLDKDFVYIKRRPCKTMPEVPGLERRYLGLQSVSREEMKEIVARLTRMTTAYTAKFGPNRNTWIDDSPKRQFAQRT